jgi:translation initiation factor 5
LLPSVDGRDDLDDFAGSTTAEAIMARRMDLADAVAGVSLEENVDPLEVFADFITSSKTDDLSSQLIISKVESLGIREDKACAVLAQVLWDENILKEKQVSLYSKLFEQFIDSSNSKSSQKCEKALIGSIERLVAVNHPELLPRVALVFKDLYQFDLVSEETFLSWDKSTAEKSKFVNTKQSTAVREKAVPFINWLKEAEEEDEESD